MINRLVVMAGFLVAILFSSLMPALGQTAGAPAEVSAPAAAVPARVGELTDAEIAALHDDFFHLRWMGWSVIAVSVALGLLVYGRLHSQVRANDSLFGLLAVLVVAPLLLTLATLTLSEVSTECLRAPLASAGDPFTGPCRDARENAANLVGMKTVWNQAAGQQVIDGVAMPLAAGAVRILLYLSSLLAAVVLYFLFKPLVRKMVIYKS